MTTPNDKLSDGRPVFHIDSSCLKDSACRLRMFFKVVRGFQVDNNGISLIFGSAVHKWKEFYEKSQRDSGMSMVKAIQYYNTNIKKATIPKQKAYLSDPTYFARVCGAFEQAHASNQRLKDMELISSEPLGPLVEIKFSIPVLETTRYVVMLTGTIDGIYKHKESGIYILNDIKTTSAADLESYLKGYELSSQLHTYVFAVQHMASVTQREDSIFKLIANRGLGFCITAVHLRGVSKDPEIYRGDVIYPDENKLQEFKAALKVYLEHNLGPTLEQYFDNDCSDTFRPYKEGLLNGSCQSAWGSGCGYFGGCVATSDQMLWAWMRNFTETSMYNPLKFR